MCGGAVFAGPCANTVTMTRGAVYSDGLEVEDDGIGIGCTDNESKMQLLVQKYTSLKPS